MSLKNIKKDLLELQGAEVKVFGQATTLPARDDEVTVDIIDLVDAFADYEMNGAMACNKLNVESVDDIDGLEYDYADNSYNWSGMASNDFDYKFYNTDDGGFVVSIKFHRFGDVRGNYTEDAFLLFDDKNDFHEIVGEQMHDFYIIVEKLEFLCTSRITDEYIRCSAKTNTGYIDADVLAYAKSDVLSELVKHKEAMA